MKPQRIQIAAWFLIARIFKIVDHRTRLLGDFGLIVLPGVVEKFQNVGKRRQVELAHRREVGAAVKGYTVRGHEEVQRPAALVSQRLEGFHVDAVDVGPFFAVDFNGVEAGVQKLCQLRVFKRFPFHDVAPVASGVADADQHRFVRFFGEGEGLVAPRVPVDGVVGVLQKVGTFLVDQLVGVFWITHRVPESARRNRETICPRTAGF